MNKFFYLIQLDIIDENVLDPCSDHAVCGICADCNVLNHRIQCSCSSNYTGNPLVECKKKPLRCDGFCPCDESGYCINLCENSSNCSCGEKCVNGGCRTLCSQKTKCPERHVCSQGACVPGCNYNNDCGEDMVCSAKQCVTVCRDNSCGKNALCLANKHHAFCSCPSGYSGDPEKECKAYECIKNEDCGLDEECTSAKTCRNVCLNACGANAICRSINRAPQCSCPPTYLGNPKVECSKPASGSCLKNPCGVNARCRDLEDGSYECTCPPGCVGIPQRQCFCGTMAPCAFKACGVNAQCRIGQRGEALCYCPRNYPNGDPNIECEFIIK